MSQDNPGAPTPASPTGAVPIHRFNEVLEERKQLRQEVEGLRQVVTRLAPQRPSAPQSPEDPRIAKLKEENPELYSLVGELKTGLMQARAANFMNNEELDRRNFLDVAGKVGRARLKEVEDILEQYRQRGIHNYNRLAIYTMLKGQESIQREQVPEGAAPAPMPPPIVPAPAPAAPAEFDYPSDNPQAQTQLRAGVAPQPKAEKSLDDWERELANEAI